jgi:antirestriction protein ArdC
VNTAVPSNPRTDIYRTITDKIVGAIKAGAGNFVMPWHRIGPARGRPTNASTGNRYRGVNVLALWAEATVAGYDSGHWATYRQWQELGTNVRKGEHGTMILFYREIGPGEQGDQSDDGEDRGRRFVARASHQVDGWEAGGSPTASPVNQISRVEQFVHVTDADIRHGGQSACYRPKGDYIELPRPERFVGSPTSSPTEAYYATLLHELTHWTGASHRLARTFGDQFGDDAYAQEELVAELGAAFLCADLGIANEPRADHAAYVSHWLRILARHPRAIFTASREATRATHYLHELTAHIWRDEPA